MAVLQANIVSSAIFGVRNYDKGNKGHVIRYAVAAGQAKKVVDYITTLNNTVGETARVATEALGSVSKNSIFLESCGNVAKFSSSHINPLIVASAVSDVLNSDNKTETAVVSATSLGTMFTVENLMKKHLKDVPKMKCFKGIAETVQKMTKGTKYGKYLAPVLEGIAFVVGSCTAYNIGENIGEKMIGKSDKITSKQGMLF